MSDSHNEILSGDRARQRPEEDAFGLDKITQSISSVLLSRISADGYAIGVEGEWGEGKSTLINFVCSELLKNPEIHRVIRFEPWLVGTKRALLAALFNLLINAIRDFGSDPVVARKLASNPTLLQSLIGKLTRYAGALEQGNAALDYAAAFDPTGHTKAGALILRLLAMFARWLAPKEKSLEDLKEQVKGDLLVLKRLIPQLRFTVMIDDLDRLDPEESVEILRLVKAVADFPIITYLVCFDRVTLAAHVNNVLKIQDGETYIEKIFQAFVPLPPQEPFALRRFVRSLLSSAFPAEFADTATKTRDRIEREQSLFDLWIGKFVETPRDAVRLAEAVKFGWPFLRGQADFIDYVWVQLLKLQCRRLFSWVRTYVVNIGSYRDGGRPGDEEPVVEAKKLLSILGDLNWDYKHDRIGLMQFLPGVRQYANTSAPKVFQIDSGELDRFEIGFRLGSPSHWSYYFSFDRPSYAIDDDALALLFRSSPTGAADLFKLFRTLMERQHDQPGYYFRVFLERLFDRCERIAADQQIELARALAEVMDSVIESPGEQMGLEGPWRRALRLLGPPVGPHFAEIVRTSASINWLADVIRDQGFALGRPDPTRERGDRQWLTGVEFDTALEAALNRFREMGIARISREPQPLQILYCWKQLGDQQELAHLISEAIEEDEVLLYFLDGIRTYVSSSDKGLYRPLRREIVSHFADADMAKKRLSHLATSSSELTSKAQELLTAWEDER